MSSHQVHHIKFNKAAQVVADSVRKPAEVMFGAAFEKFVVMETLSQATPGGTTHYIKLNIGGADSNQKVPYESMWKGAFSDPQPLQPNYRHLAEVGRKTDRYVVLRIFEDSVSARTVEGIELLPLVHYSGYSEPEHDSVRRIEKYQSQKSAFVAASSIVQITAEIRALAEAVREQAKAMYGKPFSKYDVIEGVAQHITDGTLYFLKVDIGCPLEVAHYCRGNTQCLIFRIHRDERGVASVKGLLELPNDGGSAYPARVISEGVNKA